MVCDPRDSSAGKFGTVNSTRLPLGKFVMVTFNGSITAITLKKPTIFSPFLLEIPYRGAVTLSTSRTHASNISGWRTVCDMVTPIRPQNKLIASGGKPRRRKAVKVYKRGSSQSLKTNQSFIDCLCCSYLTIPSWINFWIFRLDVTVKCKFSRPYSHCTGQ